MMVGEFLCMCVCKCMHRWVNENVSGWGERVMWESERVSEWVRGSEWVSEWGWVSESERSKCQRPASWPEQTSQNQATNLSRLIADQVLRQPRCRAPSAAKASGRAAETKGRQGVHPTPCRSDARAYIRSLCRAPSAAPATQSVAETKGRQAVHRPLAEHQVLRLPRKTYRQSGGDQGTPGRTSDPLQSTKCCACHAKATGRAAETKERQGVHPTPSAAPATQKLPAERRRPRDARAYIRPLAENQVPRLPRKTYQQSGGEQGTPGRTSDPLQSTSAAPATQNTGRAAETKGRQGVHPTPCRAPSAAPATQKLPAERRKPRYARAYIRPLAEQQELRLPRKSYRQSSGDQGTPGRTSDPLQSSKCCACHAKATGRVAETKGRQGVHPIPCRAPSAAPATQKLPAEQRRPRDARAYIRPLAEHQVLRLPR